MTDKEHLQTLQRQIDRLNDELLKLRAGKVVTGADTEHVLAALATARDGKPGSLTTVELMKRLNMTKPSVHYHISVLESANQVLVVRGKRVNGRRGPDVVYHRDAIAV